MSTDPNFEAFHLLIGPKDLKPVVLVFGAPERADAVAKQCDSYTEVKYNREYRLGTVVYEGVEFSTCSHGIGGPGAAICFEELIQLGA